MHHWPKETLNTLLRQAEISGMAKATLASQQDAKLLRYALYNYRKISGLALGARMIIEGSELQIMRANTPKIRIE